MKIKYKFKFISGLLIIISILMILLFLIIGNDLVQVFILFMILLAMGRALILMGDDFTTNFFGIEISEEKRFYF